MSARGLGSWVLFLVSTLSFHAACAAGPDPELVAAGRRVFNRCAACHPLTSTGEHGLGPNLYGVVGMKAGTQDGFSYSDALVKSGIVWTPETLDRWIHDPQALVPGSRMAFAGVPVDEERKAVVAYIINRSAGP